MRRKLKQLIAALSAASMATVIPLPLSYAAPDIPGKTPVVSYKFDGGDALSYELKGGAALVDRDEENGQAVSLSQASSQYVHLADNLTKGMTGDFTVSVDFNPSGAQWWTRVFDLGSGDSASSDFRNLFFANHSETPKFDGAIGKYVLLASEDKVSVGEWNNACIVRSGNTGYLYINGELSATSADFTLDLDYIGESANNYLGKSAYAADPYYDGLIDNFQIYDCALTQDEINTLADADSRIIEQIAQSNRFFVDAQFKDADGKKVFQAASGSPVSAEIKVTNYTLEDTEIYVTAASASGAYAYQSEPRSLASGKETTIAFDMGTPSEDVQIKLFAGGKTIDAGYLPAANAEFTTARVYADDNDDPTFGAHDPTIFKDPASGKYYAYSSHNLVFESEDLINWTKHDYTQTVTVPAEAKRFLEANYTGTTANATYWAPDVLYKAGDEYPYWFYLSTSCGLGGRNSVISLVKAKSPGLWDSDTLDCGVVMASKENNSYLTNSIDANIYSENGEDYFIWGSFWRGIYGAKLNSEGRVEGVDYTSDASILSSCANFGSALFSTPNGVMGPEGPFTIKNTKNGYTYMFTSYGWLGTNYNCRIARTDAAMSDVLSSGSDTRFLDENGNRVGRAYSQQTDKSRPWGYKLIGSYNLGGITYYGNGHNSVLNDGDDWYYVQHSRKIQDAAAYLQVRKMLFTKSGWPVVSPLVYSGEKEQAIPEAMLYGTWNLCSVGHTILDGCTNVGESGAYKGADAPVESCEIVIMPDGKLGGGLGNWSYDGDHTIALSFEKDGDADFNQYYKKGDTMELFVLTGFDEDENGGEKALVMTGTDENNVAQFAKKTSQCASYLESEPAEATEAVNIEKSELGNPIAGFDAKGKIAYGGDPSVLVDGDTVYLYVGHDTSTNDSYVIPEYLCYSSKDLVNWEYQGNVFRVNTSTVPWASGDSSAWAAQVLKHNEKYYLYYCTWASSSAAGGYQCIGVAVADSPAGPFTNVSSVPLINGQTMTTENTSTWNDIDPTGWIETDENGVEHIYLNWGNSENYTCELNSDMVSVKDQNGDGQITSADIVHTAINNLDGVYTEAPWIYRRTDADGNYTGPYYLFFAKDWREQWAYAVTDDIMSGQWEYGGLVMSAPATSNTSHGGIFDFNGKTYFIYHNGALPGGSGFRRVANIQELVFNADGSIDTMEELSTGISGSSVSITDCVGEYVGHDAFVNPLSDAAYPLSKTVTVGEENGNNTKWEVKPGMAYKGDSTYVSLQAVNKPGLYITVSGTGVVLTQDTDNAMAEAMTFITRKALNGRDGMISFESIAKPSHYLTSVNGKLILTQGSMADNCSFTVEGAAISTPAPIVTPEPEPTLSPNLLIDFEEQLPGTIISMGNENQTDTSIDGVTLYVGSRSGGDTSTSASIGAGVGEDGSQALVLSNGRFTSSSRGPRVKFYTPEIPDGGKTTMTLSVKATANEKLYINDDSAAQATAELGITKDMAWNTVKIVITNNGGTYKRTISVNGNTEITDTVSTFPVFWGTEANDSTNSNKLYFDNVEIKTSDNQEPEPSVEPSEEPANEPVIEFKDWGANAVKFVLKNAADIENISVYAAFYNSNGRLAAVSKKDISGGADETELSFPITSGLYVKAVVWKNGMEPVAVSAPKYLYAIEQPYSP